MVKYCCGVGAAYRRPGLGTVNGNSCGRPDLPTDGVHGGRERSRPSLWNPKSAVGRGQDPPYRWGSRVLCRNGLDRSGDALPLLHGKILLWCRGRIGGAREGQNVRNGFVSLVNFQSVGRSRPLPTDGVHGCFVGNGLDRSGDVCRCCMVKILLV